MRPQRLHEVFVVFGGEAGASVDSAVSGGVAEAGVGFASGELSSVREGAFLSVRVRSSSCGRSNTARFTLVGYGCVYVKHTVEWFLEQLVGLFFLLLFLRHCGHLREGE